MTVYFFYRVDPGMYPYLYGFTNEKNIMKKFKEQRNMKLFYMKTQEMKKDQYKDILKIHGHCRLQEKQYLTKNKNQINNLGVIRIVSTDSEEMSIYTNESNISMELGKLTHSYAYTFQPKLLEALTKLQYFYFRKMRDDFPLNDPFLSGVELDPKWPFSSIDEFEMFLFLYGKTLNMS